MIDLNRFHSDLYKPDLTPTIGEALELERLERAWSDREMSLALGMPYQKYLSVKADLDLPTLAQKEGLYHVLWPLTTRQLILHIRATTRRIVENAIDRAVGDASPVFIEALPPLLRACIADDLKVPADDLHAIQAGLRRMAVGNDRFAFVYCTSMEVDLEGEREWLDAFEAFFGNIDDGYP